MVTFSLISIFEQNNWPLKISENETAVTAKEIRILVLMKSGKSVNCFREEIGLVTLKQNFT